MKAKRQYDQEAERATATPPSDEMVVTTERRTETRIVGAIRPAYVSQRTSLPTFGIEPRGFLDLLPAFRADGGEVIELGKRRLVGFEAFSSWLRRRGESAEEAPAEESDSYASRLGLKLVGGSRGGR